MSGTTAQIVGPDPPGLDVDAVLQRLRQQQMGVRDPAVAPLMQKIKEAPPAAPGATPDAAPLAPGFDRFVQQESGGQQFGQDGKPLVPKNFAGDQNDPPTGAAQVRPSTARDALAKVGQPLDLNRLSTDKAYNVWVGNLIHNQLLQQYGNNAMLAAAAYNAGPGAVDSWIKQFGDPRKGEISNEDFAARIPYDETRLYVHAVGAVQGGRAAPSGGKAVDLPFNTKKIFDDLKENMFGAKQEESSALAALNESMAKLAEPPPTQEPTPAGQQWAGAAMALAAVGGLLTHRPFTTAANAMAATMTAVNEGRQAEAKQALEQWKAGHEALIAVTNYRMSLYEAAMKKYQNAPNEAKAEMEANAAALQDTAVQDALSKGDVQTAMAIISGGYAAAVTMQRESAKFQQQVQDRLESQRLVNDLAAARATKDPDKIAAAQQALQDHLAVVAPAATAAKIEIGTGPKSGGGVSGTIAANAITIADDEIAKREAGGETLSAASKAGIRNKAIQQALRNRTAFSQTIGYEQGQLLQKWSAEHPNATMEEFAQAEHELQGKNQMTPAEVSALQDRGLEIGNALDAVDEMRNSMDKVFAVAGGLGKVIAPFEVIGNITGISDSTEYKDFQRAKDQIKMAAGNLLRAKESSTLNAGTQKLLDTIVRGDNWGDTKQNVTSALDAIETAATQELRSINRRQKTTTGKDLDVISGGGSGGGAPADPLGIRGP